MESRPIGLIIRQQPRRHDDQRRDPTVDCSGKMTLLLIGIESTGASRRVTQMARTRPLVAGALRGFAHKRRRFIGVTTIFA